MSQTTRKPHRKQFHPLQMKNQTCAGEQRVPDSSAPDVATHQAEVLSHTIPPRQKTSVVKVCCVRAGERVSLGRANV